MNTMYHWSKHPWIILEASLKHHYTIHNWPCVLRESSWNFCSTLEASMKHPLSIFETALKNALYIPEQSLKHPSNILKASLKQLLYLKRSWRILCDFKSYLNTHTHIIILTCPYLLNNIHILKIIRGDKHINPKFSYYIVFIIHIIAKYKQKYMLGWT